MINKIIIWFFGLMSILFFVVGLPTNFNKSNTIVPNQGYSINYTNENDDTFKNNEYQSTYEELYKQYKLFSNKSIKNGGHALLAIYKAINDNDVLTELRAIESNKGDDNDLFSKLLKLNGKLLKNNFSGISNNLTIKSDNFDGVNLQDFNFLSILTNLQNLSILDYSTNTANSFKINDADDFIWINNLSNLKYLQIKNNKRIHLKKQIDFNSKIFTSRKLMNIDLSNLIYVDNTEKTILNNFSENTYWFANKQIGFELILPKQYNQKNLKPINITKTSNNIGLVLTKTINAQIDYLDFKEDNLNIDGIKYKKTLYKSNVFWDVPTTILSGVKYFDEKNKIYYTNSSVNVTPISPTIISNQYLEEWRKKELESTKTFDLELTINNLSRENLKKYLENDIIYVDGMSRKRFLNKGKVLWDVNIKEIKFASEDLTHFWTKYEKITNEDLRAYKVSEYKSFSKINKNWREIFENNKMTTPSEDDVAIVDNYLKVNPYFSKKHGKFIFLYSLEREYYFNTINKFKYYSAKDHAIFSNFDLLSQSKYDLNNFIEITESNQIDHSSIDNDPKNMVDNITKEEEVNKMFDRILAGNKMPTFKIDGFPRKYFLKENKFYLDYQISKIKYIVETPNGNEYFSIWNNIPTNLKPKAKLYKTKQKFSPVIKLIKKPLFGVHENSEINVIKNGEFNVISVAISNGKLFWDFRGYNIDINEVKYIDGNGNYYAMSLRDILLKYKKLPKNLSSVILSSKTVIKKPKKSSLLNPNLSLENFELIKNNKFIIVDNTKYFRQIINSIIQWVSNNNEKLNISNVRYQTISSSIKNGETNHFFTSLKAAMQYSTNFPDGIVELEIQKEVQVNILKTNISEPKSINDSLKIEDGNKEILIDAVMDPINGLHWDNTHDGLLKKVRFSTVDNKNNMKFYTDISRKILEKDPKIKITDAKIILDEMKQQEKNSLKDIVHDKQSSVLTFVIIFSVFISGAIATIIYLFISRRNRG